MTVQPLLRTIRLLTPPKVEELLGRDRVIRRAQAYAAEGRVDEVWIDGRALRAHVAGSSETPYHTVIRLIDGEVEAECSCPYERGTCWHAGSVLLALIAEPTLIDELENQAGRGRSAAPRETEDTDSGVVAEEPDQDESALPPVRTKAERLQAIRELRAELLAWPKEEMFDLLAEAAVDDPLVETRIRQRFADTSNMDVRLFRQAARSALRSGRGIGRYEVARIAADLEEITVSVRRLVVGGHPETALMLLQEIAWLAWARLGELDDRDGALVALIRDVLRQWCAGWAEVDGRDRQALAREIFGWLMEDGSGMTEGLVLDAEDALGPIGLDTLTGLLRPVLEKRQQARRGALTGDEENLLFDPIIERARAALREIAELRRDAEAFLQLCDAGGRQGTEILAAARRFEQLGQPVEALAWAERGRRKTRGIVRTQIEDLRISLLYAQGRRREAIEGAWEVLTAEPGIVSYKRLMGVVGEEDRSEWRRRALDQSEAGSDATAFLEICIAAGETERLSHRLDSSPGYVLAGNPATLERAAEMLDGRILWASARIYLHLASQLLAIGDARHYGRVRRFLETARLGCEREGENELWLDSIQRIRDAHDVVKAWYPAT